MDLCNVTHIEAEKQLAEVSFLFQLGSGDPNQVVRLANSTLTCWNILSVKNIRILPQVLCLQHLTRSMEA